MKTVQQRSEEFFATLGWVATTDRVPFFSEENMKKMDEEEKPVNS